MGISLSRIRSSMLFNLGPARLPNVIQGFSVTALSKGSLFMFNQEDQLPAHCIMTHWNAHSPGSQLGSVGGRAIDIFLVVSGITTHHWF